MCFVLRFFFFLLVDVAFICLLFKSNFFFITDFNLAGCSVSSEAFQNVTFQAEKF